LYQINIWYTNQNVSLSPGRSYEFQYRKTALHKVSIPFLFNGAFFSSLTAQATEGNASVNGIWGASYAGFAFPPTSILAYFETSVTFDNIQNWMNWNVNSSSGFIGNVFLRLDEKTSNQTIVNTQRLGLMAWTISDQFNNGSLKYVTFQGQSGAVTVLITFIVSDIVGIVNYGNAMVSPKSLESIFEIPNYPYKSPTNYLTLTLGVVTGSTSVNVYGTANVLQCGSATEKVYFSLSNTAQINGVTKSVKISSFITGNATSLENSNIINQAQSKYSTISIQLVSIDFPPNASSIIYDPTLGSGTPLASPDNYIAIIITLVVVGSIALIILIVVLVFMFRKKPYKEIK